MEAKTKISFDELDLKVLNELPLISEVLSTTSNKLVRLFTPIYQKVLETCNKNIPKGWEIDKKQLENVIYPFSSVDGREKVTSLENYFQIKSSITFILKQDKKWINFIEIQFGLYYNEDYEENKNPYFYFLIYRDPSARFQGKMYPLSYYENIKSKYKDFNFTIEHSDKGNDSEHIELTLDITSTDKIIQASEIFTFEILPEYLKGIRR
jgi:hypothetical protein